MNWYEYEHAKKPTSRTITIGRLHEFVFNVPYGARDSLPPAKGTDVAAIEQFKTLGIEGITGIGARVKRTWIGRSAKMGMCEMHVEIIEPLAYS